jgi:hypothetical protein
MTALFQPKLEFLPATQRCLWDELDTVPEEFVLYGGTAIALHLGHRESVDYDFFGDGNLARLPRDVQDRIAKAAREVNLDKLPEILIEHYPEESRPCQ